ncbi:MAG: ComF family protein [Phycisphaerales bacterium]
MKLIEATGRCVRSLRELIWHNYCRNCKSIISHEDQFFCSQCTSKIGLCFVDNYCRRCGREIGEFTEIRNCPKCEDENYIFDEISCVGIYKPPLSNLILSFKLADQTALTRVLGDFAQKAFVRSGFLNQSDYLVPVPMHVINLFKRGFNQSYLIAKKIVQPGMEINCDLVRVRYTKTQTSVTFAQRSQNVRNAFAVRKNHNFSNKNICLIDDVKTSGATLNECAKVLKEAGAKKVFAFVLAVAGQGK